MKIKKQKLLAIIIAGVIAASMLAGCSSQTFVASDSGWPRQDSYEFPFMGMKAVLPDELLKKMEKKEVSMLDEEDRDDDGKTIQYAFLTWNKLTKEQREAEVKTEGETVGEDYFKWKESLERVGTLGMFSEEASEKLDELTGCTKHQEIGSSSDGKYKYYLSTNEKADQELIDEINSIQTTLAEIQPVGENSAFDMPEDESDSNVSEVGEFKTTDIDGKEYTQKIFEDYELTLVNAFTTWCSPCIEEMPYLDQLRKEMKAEGVNVVGIVMDTVDESGNIDKDVVEKTKLLKERAKVTYPILIPDSGYLNGRVGNLQGFPETFFVDKNGKIVGETYQGSTDLKEWRKIVKTELARMKGE